MSTDGIVRCTRCGVKMIEVRRLTLKHDPLCDYCTLGMDPATYLIVGAEPHD